MDPKKNERDNAGHVGVEVSSDGVETTIGLGNGLAVDSSGEVSMSLGSGVRMEMDGDIVVGGINITPHGD